MRVLVCGGRTYDNEAAVWRALDDLVDKHLSITVIEGGARSRLRGMEGADAFAARWCERNHLVCGHEQYRADWDRYGKKAGVLRNQQMLDTRPDLVLAFPGGRGTADMVQRARKAGVEVIEYPN
jgi:hypothetical protein